MFRLHLTRMPLPSSSQNCTASLCPTMDLICFTSPSGPHIACYRSIDFERLFAFVCSSNVECITWKPDGKELACALSEGKVMIIDVETCLEEGHRSIQAKVLYWTGFDKLDVLVAASNENVQLLAFGNFALCGIELELNVSAVVHVLLSTDLRTLIAVTKTIQYKYVLTTWSTSFVAESKKEIAQIASEFTNIDKDLVKLQGMLTKARLVWEKDVLGHLKKWLNPLLDAQDGGFVTNQNEATRMDRLHQVFFDLYTRGAYSLSSTKYLQKYASESSMNRFSTLSNKGLDGIFKLFKEAMFVAERVLYRLGDLQGLAKCNVMFQRLGVTVDFVEPFLIRGENLLLALRRCVRSGQQVREDFAAFDRWLRGCAKRWLLPETNNSPGNNNSDPRWYVGFTAPKDARRIERMLREQNLEHFAFSMELGCESTNVAMVEKDELPDWARGGGVDVEEEVVVGDSGDDAGGGANVTSLASLTTSFVSAWQTQALERVSQYVNETIQMVDVQTLFTSNFECDSNIALSSNDEGECHVLFCDPSSGIVTCAKLSGDNDKEEKQGWQTKSEYTFEPEDTVASLAFCGGTPGRRPANQDVAVCVTVRRPREASRLICLSMNEIDGLKFVKECPLGVADSRGIACSGPRGVVCVWNFKRKLELIDVAHDEDAEEEENDKAIEEL